jgi:hypothetical protein
MTVRDMPTPELVDALRRAAAVWFRNDHLLLLEELIRRVPRPSNAAEKINTVEVQAEGEP